ncbi:MAG: UDP-N-acetylmuramoyl-L-alanine--D-glutamate ligase [Acidimicrobiales bacterium]|nr:UDP-N-acetylmuramoyl-L-alanine--D-glutamate ligase [Acidimicrobiales bacterium]
MSGGPLLVVGLGVAGRSVVAAARARGFAVTIAEDRPTSAHEAFAEAHGARFLGRPGAAALRRAVLDAAAVVPSPGVPDRHPCFVTAAEQGVPVRSELDLAAEWDARPVVAITGTNGKTTTTTLVSLMLDAAGIPNLAAGNTDVPLVEAIDDPTPEWFVVEASSFRLGHSDTFAPRVAAWGNFAPDHLDVHRSLAAYEAAKASIWARLGPGDVAVADVEDEVVARHAPVGARRIGLGGSADLTHTVRDGWLVVEGERFLALADLPRRRPHDLRNALMATASALAAGAAPDAIRSVLVGFDGLPHRVQPVGEVAGVRFFDDSKATSPHAVIAAVNGFDRPVLVAGGRNKGIDLGELAVLAEDLSAVVAIGESAVEIAAAFAGRCPVRVATTMADAVAAGLELARAAGSGTVLLSPACASYDWYRNYGERGDDFAREVARLAALEGAGLSAPEGDRGGRA